LGWDLPVHTRLPQFFVGRTARPTYTTKGKDMAYFALTFYQEEQNGPSTPESQLFEIPTNAKEEDIIQLLKEEFLNFADVAIEEITVWNKNQGEGYFEPGYEVVCNDLHLLVTPVTIPQKDAAQSAIGSGE